MSAMVLAIFCYFSLVESSDDYINDDEEPAPFVIMPPTSSNIEVNTAGMIH